MICSYLLYVLYFTVLLYKISLVVGMTIMVWALNDFQVKANYFNLNVHQFYKTRSKKANIFMISFYIIWVYGTIY